MKIRLKIKETRLTDGSKVFDVIIFPNGGTLEGNQQVILSCEDLNHAINLFTALDKAITDFSMEETEEV